MVDYIRASAGARRDYPGAVSQIPPAWLSAIECFPFQRKAGPRVDPEPQPAVRSAQATRTARVDQRARRPGEQHTSATGLFVDCGGAATLRRVDARPTFIVQYAPDPRAIHQPALCRRTIGLSDRTTGFAPAPGMPEATRPIGGGAIQNRGFNRGFGFGFRNWPNRFGFGLAGPLRRNIAKSSTRLAIL